MSQKVAVAELRLVWGVGHCVACHGQELSAGHLVLGMVGSLACGGGGDSLSQEVRRVETIAS